MRSLIFLLILELGSSIESSPNSQCADRLDNLEVLLNNLSKDTYQKLENLQQENERLSQEVDTLSVQLGRYRHEIEGFTSTTSQQLEDLKTVDDTTATELTRVQEAVKKFQDSITEKIDIDLHVEKLQDIEESLKDVSERQNSFEVVNKRSKEKTKDVAKIESKMEQYYKILKEQILKVNPNTSDNYKILGKQIFEVNKTSSENFEILKKQILKVDANTSDNSKILRKQISEVNKTSVNLEILKKQILEDANASDKVRFLEREMRKDNCSAVYLKTPISCKESSIEPGWHAPSCEKAFDGRYGSDDPSEDWASHGEGGGAWIEVTFGKATNIKTIKLLQRSSKGEQNSEVRIDFDDGISFTFPVPIQGSGQFNQIELPNEVLTSKVKIIITRVYSKAYNGWKEIQFYGCF